MSNHNVLNNRPILSGIQINKGLNLVIKEGLAAEAMSTLTGGTFLVALAMLLGASNIQIGLLAALPTLTNVCQLLAIWILQRYQNRRQVSVISNILARFPLLVIGFLPFLFSTTTSIQVLLFLLTFHYFFGSIAGASWNSWMKDLVPEKILGSYFSRRGRLTQILNVVLSLIIAVVLDHVKQTDPGNETFAYSIMFIAGGIIGLVGTYILSRTPEPDFYISREIVFKLFAKPLQDKNFRKLVLFNSYWSFALNLATPFFVVYMLSEIELSLSAVIAFGILSQLSGIFSVRLWGKYADRFSNKTVIRIAAPMYILCIVGWAYVGMADNMYLNLILVGLINMMTGVSTSGINLAISNIGLKLAPKEEAAVYLSARNMIVAFVSALGPIVGGVLADYFSTKSFSWNISWANNGQSNAFHLLELHSWNFLFIIAGLLALISLRSLRKVQEQGEIGKQKAIAEIKVVFSKTMKETLSRDGLISIINFPITYPAGIRKKIRRRNETMKKWNKRREVFLEPQLSQLN